MPARKMITTFVALTAITALFLAGCSDRPGNSVNPADVVSNAILNNDAQETAWAYDCYEDGMNATCFMDIANLPANKWGWSNGAYAPDSTYYFDLYAGAGQCNVDNGYLVGMVTLDYSGSTAEVTYETYCNFTLEEVHLWVGDDMLPMKNNGHYTAAPGQFPWSADLSGEIMYSFEIEDLSGDIYMAAHAVVAGDFSNYDCDAVSVCDQPEEPEEWVIFGASFDADNVDGDDLYAIDILDMTSTMIQETGLNPDSSTYPNGLAYDPDNERLYFTTIMPTELYGYDLNTGTQWNAGDVTGAIACGAWWDGNYYYIPQNTDDLYMVSFDASGNITANDLVAENFTDTPKLYTFGDIVARDGMLYGSAWDSDGDAPNSEYFSIDLDSGSYDYNFLFYSSVVPAMQVAFGEDQLYAHDTGSGLFYEVDLTAETETSIGSLSGTYSNFTDLASGPAPVPMTSGSARLK